MDGWSHRLPPLSNFILPAGAHVGRASASLHVCRTVCRRAERAAVAATRAAHRKEGEADNDVAMFLNRLSDFFFVAARVLSLEGDSARSEVLFARPEGDSNGDVQGSGRLAMVRTRPASDRVPQQRSRPLLTNDLWRARVALFIVALLVTVCIALVFAYCTNVRLLERQQAASDSSGGSGGQLRVLGLHHSVLCSNSSPADALRRVLFWPAE